MKKILAAALALMLVLSMGSVHAEQKKLNILCTTFPSYDWMRNILGDRLDAVNLTLLQDSGADLHNFQPTAQDFIKVSSADMLVYIGGPSDNWMEDAIKEAKNKDMVVVNLLKALGEDAVMGVTVEGMQEGAHAHDHGDEHDHEDETAEEHAQHDEHDHEDEKAEEHDEHADDHDHEGETPEEHAAHAEEHEHEHEEHDEHGEHEDHDHDDHAGHVHNHEDEHIWLSLRNAQKLSRVMAMELAFLDADNASTYLANQKAYAEKLDNLDKQYQAVVDAAQNKTLLFGDRFPFRYLTEDYGLTYYAAFSGCSAETEASFETVAFLANKADELKLPAILVLDGSDGKIAKAVLGASKDNTRPLIVMDAMQTVDAQMVKEGVTYLGVMEKNLESLKEALK